MGTCVEMGGTLWRLVTTCILATFVKMADSLDCHITTEQRELVPHFITCFCDEIEEVFEWPSLESIDQDLLPFFPTITFNNCTNLFLDLVPPHPEPLPELVVNNMEEVVMSVSMATMNITLSNVTSVLYLGQQGPDPDQIYFYLSIGLATLCGVLVIVLIIAMAIVRLRHRRDPEHKKVSRAESWRYEPSMYVNHSPGPKPVYVAPPLPPPGSEGGGHSEDLPPHPAGEAEEEHHPWDTHSQ